MIEEEKQLAPFRHELVLREDGARMEGYLQRAHGLLLKVMGGRCEGEETAREALVRLAGEERIDTLADELIMASLIPFEVEGRYEAIVTPECFTEDTARPGRDFHYRAIVCTRPPCSISDFGPVHVTLATPDVTHEDLERQEALIMTQAARTEDGRTVVPALTDAWVRGNIRGCSTVPEFEEMLMADMRRQREDERKTELDVRCAEALEARLTAEPDEDAYRRSAEEVAQAFEDALARMGHTVDEYLHQTGATEEMLTQMQARQGRAQLRQGLALDVLADHLGIEATQEDLDGFFREVAAGHELEAQVDYSNQGRMPEVERNIRRSKARAWLRSTAVVEEAPTSGR